MTDLRLRFPYFSHVDPLVFETQGSYADRSASVAQKVEYGWNHGMGEVVTALAGAGLRIDFLHEFPFAEWPVSFLQLAPRWHLSPATRARRPAATLLLTEGEPARNLAAFAILNSRL